MWELNELTAASMGFPPRPPMPIPGLPPVPQLMGPPPFGHHLDFTYCVPGGMIPVAMNFNPAQMMGPVMLPQGMSLQGMPKQNQVQIKKSPMTISQPPVKRIIPINTLPENLVGKGPPVTVFVGNITERASDSLIRQILQRCGTVINWKRVQGANGKLQAFGFCEYGDPESGLRAIRVLHDWDIGDKKLVVKVDPKAKERLDEYKASKKASGDKGGPVIPDDDNQLDEMTKEHDSNARTSIVYLLHEHHIELSRIIPDAKDKNKKLSKTQETLIKMSQEDKNVNQVFTSNLSKNKNLDEMDLEDEKRSLIHREIDKFRDTYKRAEEEKERKDKERSARDRERSPTLDKDKKEVKKSPTRSPDRDKERKRDRDRDRERDRERDRSNREDRERERERDKERDRERAAHREFRDRPNEERFREHSRSQSKDRESTEWNRERDIANERINRERDWDRNDRERGERERDRVEKDDNDEDSYEKKKMERKMREKEAAYKERLRNWETREKRKKKDYEKESLKETEKRHEEMKEARRLKEFLEDYDDDRDDPKYYKGSSLMRRLKEREKEMDADHRDKQKENEELEELRKKLAEEGHPNPQEEASRIYQEEEARLNQPAPVMKLKVFDPEEEKEIFYEPRKNNSNHHARRAEPSSPQFANSDSEDSKPAKKVAEDDSTQNSLISGFSDVVSPNLKKEEVFKPIGFAGLKLGNSPVTPIVNKSPNAINVAPQMVLAPIQGLKKKRMTVEEVFNTNEDDMTELKKKRKLIPLDELPEDDESKSSGGNMTHLSTDEKRKHIKNLIDKIPTTKDELFTYNVDWNLVDSGLMERRIRPWINKKIIEYIGEEEPTLVEFICSKVLVGSAAQSILDDVSMVLDDEAEVFVVKMWRLLIYEIEAKKLGIVKS